MRCPRILDLKRWIVCAGVAALLVAMAGCGESAGGPTASTDPANNPGVTQKNARIQAFGKAGVGKSTVGKPR
jgi:hypothetical protein